MSASEADRSRDTPIAVANDRLPFSFQRTSKGLEWRPSPGGLVFSRLLAGRAATFRVGRADTPASTTRRLPDVDAVESLLAWLGRRPEAQR